MASRAGEATIRAPPAFNPREVVSRLISSIPASDQQSQPNPLREVPDEARSIFLTLYTLFEKELLPALDLLDRGLVIRLQVAVAEVVAGHETSPSHTVGRNFPVTYLVRSAQQHTSRNAAYEHTSHNEVRLKAWSCSCPAFAFSAFPPSTDPPTQQAEPPLPVHASPEEPWLFGGITRGTDMPVCKHLLACVLVEHCALFSHLMEERHVSPEEFAGWSVGWGD